MMISKYIDPYLETRKAELKNDLNNNNIFGPSVIEYSAPTN